MCSNHSHLKKKKKGEKLRDLRSVSSHNLPLSFHSQTLTKHSSFLLSIISAPSTVFYFLCSSSSLHSSFLKTLMTSRQLNTKDAFQLCVMGSLSNLRHRWWSTAFSSTGDPSLPFYHILMTFSLLSGCPLSVSHSFCRRSENELFRI